LSQDRNHTRPSPGADHDHTIPEPEVFSWFDPAVGEHYVAIEPRLLEAVRKIAELHAAQTQIMIRIARVDRTSGRVVFGARIRPLDERPPEQQ
jgi:hypothetical protein